MTTFNPAAEHRCARCGQWWWKTHICSVQIGQVLPLPVLTPSEQVEVTTTDKLTAERDALRAEVERLRAACSRENDTISQVLGRALGYPRFADDQKNFPGATDADGVCVGDHVAASLADEAANTIRTLRAEVETLRTTIEHVAAIAHCGGWVGLSEDQTIVYVRMLTVGSMPRGTLNASVAALKEAVNAARAAQEGKA